MMLRRLIRWLQRADVRPGPEERVEPTDLGEARTEYAAETQHAERALAGRTQSDRLDSYRRLSHHGRRP